MTTAPVQPAADDVLVARQPIYDRGLTVSAYKLLVQQRGSEDEAATSNTIAELGLNLVMGHPAYIRVSRTFLLEGYARTLPADRVVFEISPDVGLDPEVTEAIRELAADRYPIALDGFVFGGSLHELLDIASVVKLDVRAFEGGLLRDQVERVRPYGTKLLASNVEHHEEAAMCDELGFDLLQGYFFCKPRVVSSQGLHPNQITQLQLISALHSSDIQIDELQAIISRDVGLSYSLLRFVNSAFFSLPRRVESLSDALVLLGLRNVRRWATLVALAGADDKPHELVVTALVRGRMCELVARESGQQDTEGFFTAGMFSVIDALMDRSMVEVLSALPFSPEMIKALLNYEGPKGRALRAVLAYERGAFGELGQLPPLQTPLSDLYASAVEWATEASGRLDG
jgi:EAL and modified HD-GYP domain-containing signal transduction protein